MGNIQVCSISLIYLKQLDYYDHSAIEVSEYFENLHIKYVDNIFRIWARSLTSADTNTSLKSSLETHALQNSNETKIKPTLTIDTKRLGILMNSNIEKNPWDA